MDKKTQKKKFNCVVIEWINEKTSVRVTFYFWSLQGK